MEIEKNMKKLHTNFWGEILAFGLLLIVLLYSVQFTTLHFDGAMNYQISQNLALDGEYRSNYVDYGYNGLTETWFDHKIQTAGSVMFFTTVINWILGCDPINMQYVTVLHLFFLSIVLYVYLKRYLPGLESFLASLLVITLTVQNAYNGYGELSVALFIFLSTVMFVHALEKRSNIMCFSAGIILGIGYLTKTVCLISVPAFVLSFVMDFLVHKKIRTIIPYIYLAVGMLFPVIVFEIYKLASLGLGNYVYWWEIEFSNILSESGASDGLGDTTTGIAKWYNNFKIYLSTYHVSASFFIIMLLSVPVSVMVMQKQKIAMDRSILIFYFVGLIYVIWWIFIVPAPRLWWRRAIIGHVFLLICVTTCIGKLGSILPAKYRQLVNGMISVVLLAAIVAQIPSNMQYFEDEIKNRDSIQLCANYLEELPDDAVFYGCDWWQNPQIAAEANCTIQNIEDYPDFYGDAYFITDHSVSLLAPDAIVEVMDEYNGELILSENGNSIYKLSMEYPDTPSSSLDACNALSGYHDDGWVGITACFTVKSSEVGSVRINGYYPFEITGAERIHILYNGESKVDYQISNPEIQIEFDCEPDENGILKIETNFAQNATPPDRRVISFILSDIQVN